MEERQRGEEIIKAVYKAAYQALFAIGVKSPQYIDQFSMEFSNALDREFLKIGLLSTDSVQVRPSSQDSPPVPFSEPEPSTLNPIEELHLRPLTTKVLKEHTILTIQDLMTRMQRDPLTKLKGVRETRAMEILQALKRWNSQSQS